MPNRLAKEKSPYLLQHKDNPVDWYAWGPEAFEAARAQDKPIFLSVGYSTCYWCHVMEKDSFESPEVAKLLNKGFISIKLDREERPDIDQIYMDAVVALTGHGGWPMSVMLTPDLEPFWGGAYFPRDQFIQILNRIGEIWQSERDKVASSASQIRVYLRHERQLGVADLDDRLFPRALAALAEIHDSEGGGFGPAPKFPPTGMIGLLLRIHRRSGSQKALEMATRTLDAMSRGGIYDQLGGGFHRYATDAAWKIPHFEKMLYDNALLATCYAEAYQLTKNSRYLMVVRETIDYALREMLDPAGGFYSAQDAGEVGKEGQYYVWRTEDISGTLNPQELHIFCEAYNLKAPGNFEGGTTILNLNPAYENVIERDPMLPGAREKVLALRRGRVAPHLDDKILTGWNGLMLTALAKGFQVVGDARYLEAAKACVKLIETKLIQGERLLRRYRDGDARYPAYLEDYAYLIEGLLHLYECDFDYRWINLARKLQSWQDKYLWDGEGGAYFFSSAEEIIARRKELTDGATPSPNAVSLINLMKLHSFLQIPEHAERAETIFRTMSGMMQRYPIALTRALQALDFRLNPIKEIAILKGLHPERVNVVLDYAYGEFHPNRILSVGQVGDAEGGRQPPFLLGKICEGGETTIYVCEGNVCKQPTRDPAKASKTISACNKYEV